MKSLSKILGIALLLYLFFAIYLPVTAWSMRLVEKFLLEITPLSSSKPAMTVEPCGCESAARK